MDPNPYAPPATETSKQQERAKGSIRYHVFHARPVSFSLMPQDFRDKVRKEAEEFINSEVGCNNIVSITEHTGGTFEGFSVAVWYHFR